MKEEETSFKRREEKARKKASRRALVLPLFFAVFLVFFFTFSPSLSVNFLQERVSVLSLETAIKNTLKVGEI